MRIIAAAAALLVIIATAMLPVTAPAEASTKEGVEKWKQGAYKEAVMAWLPPAARGDANALFNLGLASRQGRGLPKNLDKAEDFFRRAADKGHNPARTYLGIFLARKGQDEEAVRLWRLAQRAGEPYAHYMLGIKMFNGDLVEKDWPRAYAYMLVARNSGLRQASRALVKMDANMPPAVREEGRKIADDMLTTRKGAPLAATDASPAARAAAIASAEGTRPTPATIAAATAADQNEGPAKETPTPIRAEAVPPATTATKTSGYRVQLGAFGRAEIAREGWAAMRAAHPEILRNIEPVFVEFEGGIRLQIGKFNDRSPARILCQRLEAAGRACFVTPIS